jgi:tryptophan-rich hypothetical protein
MTPIQAKKLLLSKWTAVNIVAKEKHFIVTKIVDPETPQQISDLIEIEAVFSQQQRRISWRELQDETTWKRGWL